METTEGDGNADDGEYDTTESRILNEDPHSLTLTLTSTLDAGFNVPEAPSVQRLAARDDRCPSVRRTTRGASGAPMPVPLAPPAPETNDELETLQELEETRRLKERIERLLTQCAGERAATSRGRRRADPSPLGARSSPPPPPPAAPLRFSPRRTHFLHPHPHPLPLLLLQ